MRILIVNQWFEPEPTFKGLPFAKALMAAGHDVEVITGYPNYPLGELYPGYEMRGFRRELIEGVPVIRAPLYPSHGRSAVKRALNYLTFSLSATVASLFMARRPDVTYFYVPAVTASSPTLALKLLRGSKIVLDIQDLWPEALKETGMLANGLLLRIIGMWCSLVYRLSDAIIVLSEGYRRRLIARGTDSHKVRVIENWAPDEDLPIADSGPSIRDLAGSASDEMLVLYAGNMGPAQDLVSLLPAMLEESVRNARVRLVLMGGGSEKGHVKEEIARLGLDNVSVLDAVPKSMAKAFIAQADAVLVHLKASPILDDTVPSKVQSYLASGTPILAGVGKEAEALVLASGGGITFAQSSAQSFATALNKLVAMGEEKRREMRASAQDFYGQRLSMGRAISQTIDVLRDTVYGSGDSTLRTSHDVSPVALEISLGTKQDLQSLVEVHQAAFPGHLMTVLGRAFLTRYYELAVDCKGSVILLAREGLNGEVAGFAVGYTDPSEFYRRLVGARVRLGLSAALYAGCRPWIWSRVAVAFRRARSASVDRLAQRAELASLAVLPDREGRGIGQALVRRLLSIAVEMGAREVALTTDADGNVRVVRFYQKLGFVVSKEMQVTPERKMYELLWGRKSPEGPANS